MQKIEKFKCFIIVTLLTASIGGCAFNPITSDTNERVVADSTFGVLAARDVVSVLKQIDSLAVDRTTLGTPIGSLGQDSFADQLTPSISAWPAVALSLP